VHPAAAPLDALAELPAELPRCLYLRHAARGPTSDPISGAEVLLTTQGLIDAGALGRELAAQGPLALLHSPVRRCGQTVEAMAAGAREFGGSAEILGEEPGLAGPYMLRPREALETATRLADDFVRTWFDGALPTDLILPRAAAARQQMAVALAARRRVRGGLVVLVSHDWNLMTVLEELWGLRHEEAGWPPFLSGLALADAGSAVLLACGRRQVRVLAAELGAWPADGPGVGEGCLDGEASA
jgi:hypothetical protein